MIAIASLHDLAIPWKLHDPDCICEKAKAKESVESRTCGEWRDSYLTSNVLASSRSLGIMVNPLMTNSVTTLLISRFLSFFFFFP
jgi:hypothetical protein